MISSSHSTSAQDGLPDHLFKYVSSITPLVNIDILLINQNNEFMLTWRDDGIYGPGWHVPGGIVRFKESVHRRISEVCRIELNINNYTDLQLVQVNQIMNPDRDFRGHFISFLFSARVDLQSSPEQSDESGKPLRGWFTSMPTPMIRQHTRYISIVNQLLDKTKTTPPRISEGNLLTPYYPSTDYISDPT